MKLIRRLWQRLKPVPPPRPWPIGLWCNIWEGEPKRLVFTAKVRGRDSTTGRLWIELYGFLGAERGTLAMIDPTTAELTYHLTGAEAQAVYDAYKKLQTPAESPQSHAEPFRILGR